MLNVEASAREIHFLLQHKLLQNQRKLRFGFVCFKLVQFSDKEELIGYCKDSCGDDYDVGPQLGACDIVDDKTSDIPHSLVCTCAEQLMAIVGGKENLYQLMQDWPQQQQQQPRLEVSVSDMEPNLAAVRPQFGFMQWGVVNLASGSCHTCHPGSRSCRHRSPDSEHREGPDWLSDQAWDLKLRDFIDSSTGMRKLRCLNSSRIPCNPRDASDVEAARIRTILAGAPHNNSV